MSGYFIDGTQTLQTLLSMRGTSLNKAVRCQVADSNELVFRALWATLLLSDRRYKSDTRCISYTVYSPTHFSCVREGRVVTPYQKTEVDHHMAMRSQRGPKRIKNRTLPPNSLRSPSLNDDRLRLPWMFLR